MTRRSRNDRQAATPGCIRGFPMNKDRAHMVESSDLGGGMALRLLAGLTVGIYLGLHAPKYIRQCREMCECYFQALHDEAHRDGQA